MLFDRRLRDDRLPRENSDLPNAARPGVGADFAGHSRRQRGLRGQPRGRRGPPFRIDQVADVVNPRRGVPRQVLDGADNQDALINRRPEPSAAAVGDREDAEHRVLQFRAAELRIHPRLPCDTRASNGTPVHEDALQIASWPQVRPKRVDRVGERAVQFKRLRQSLPELRGGGRIDVDAVPALQRRQRRDRRPVRPEQIAPNHGRDHKSCRGHRQRQPAEGRPTSVSRRVVDHALTFAPGDPHSGHLSGVARTSYPEHGRRHPDCPHRLNTSPLLPWSARTWTRTSFTSVTPVARSIGGSIRTSRICEIRSSSAFSSGRPPVV
jgi:hypothetical protein